MNSGIVLLSATMLVVPFGTNAALPVGATGTEVVDSEESLIEILELTQESIQGISPPSLLMYVDRPANPYPVDWTGFEKKTTKYMTAEMDQYGLPRYRLLLWEDVVTRDRVIALASTGYEIARIPAPTDYQPEAYYLGMLSGGAVYSDSMSWIFDPAHTATEVILYPEALFPSYEQYEAEAAALEAVALPMMAMSSPPPPGGTNGIPVNIGPSTNNLLVELTFSLSEDSGRYIEVFRKDNLVYSPSWEVGDSWIPTYGNATISWVDPSSSNHMQRFYLVSDGADADGDGFSDLREAWVSGTDSNVFNLVDADGDGMHDFWETKLFGDLSQVGSGDFDGDGLLNNEEMIFDSDEPSVAVLTDPSLFSSDGDGLGDGEQFDSPPTDPWNSDTAPPVAAIVSPTNETVIVP